MNNHCPFARLNRRQFLGASAAALPADLGLSVSRPGPSASDSRAALRIMAVTSRP